MEEGSNIKRAWRKVSRCWRRENPAYEELANVEGDENLEANPKPHIGPTSILLRLLKLIWQGMSLISSEYPTQKRPLALQTPRQGNCIGPNQWVADFAPPLVFFSYID